MRHAMGGVVLENFVLDLPQRGFDRLHLVENVDAVALLFQHASNAANLALDAREAGQQFWIKLHG